MVKRMDCRCSGEPFRILDSVLGSQPTTRTRQKETGKRAKFHEVSQTFKDIVDMSVTLARYIDLDKLKWTLSNFEAL